ncbi:endoplasmic reticulum-based factor for assembly of V-ATPase-domain-containing protein [Coniella lustricola]|uniref:Endoplasmic reticulum-based factor for assembly of V-ATPase-domain-containing protein n=1 Tax=Coniella lustricola TaxID=2025994 RepID=A0A2T3A0D0_9PEZI|nr:endoplasmic reticulum-based factor for assembly of V-ATPase-domain-containing protein [Coniella lustricola]
MVLLTMTHSIVEALQIRDKITSPDTPAVEGEPPLDEPAVGQPITHSQILDLCTSLQGHGVSEYSLESLLSGARVYIPPPPPKPEPTPEYKALMARLRHDEEERKYQRMVKTANAPLGSQQYATLSSGSLAHSFAEVNRPSNKVDEGDNEVTLDEVHRQMVLIINFLLTILGTAATLWILARWWNTPARLFLTMGGSAIVGVAEIGVYYAYIWHLGEAKKKDQQTKEVQQVVETWVVDKQDSAQDIGGDKRRVGAGYRPDNATVRMRKAPGRAER